MVMSVSDGGAPFVAQNGASPTSGAGGTWTVTVRNTGTSASSGTTQVQFNAAINGNAYGYLQTSGGSGWTCDNNGYGYAETCTNSTAVPAGGSLPPLTFPYAPLPGYGHAAAEATLTNPSDGTLNNNDLRIDTPVVEQLAVNLSMSVSDGGAPFVARKDASPTSPPSGTWTVTVRNTGTAASSGTTQVQFDTAPNGGRVGYLQTSGGSGWTCSDNGSGQVEICTNTAVVPAGGSLPPLAFPFASIATMGADQDFPLSVEQEKPMLPSLMKAA